MTKVTTELRELNRIYFYRIIEGKVDVYLLNLLEKQSEVDSDSVRELCQMVDTTGMGSGRARSQNPTRSPMWVRGAHVLEPSPPASQVH